MDKEIISGAEALMRSLWHVCSVSGGSRIGIGAGGSD